ncbi:Succinyl-CoA:(R)-benzylsuccinate CoA-transferase subunit BbsF [Stieleria maiorica]|uniref:Succinyl-CoA:(R)-benzylsuccinate CoA-transferase subunit BbsF n=1 Tax=Stieleria maiorica TaxID=2795974 RepID=A0A5B9MQR9_9BACT|nr:CaiB/BaiF CoA-transferase family protein [Stieleria maiorica]QEG02601.1 Succinyl-CoA:(R)-benzylsuccinate CoA-transferase subunit BbsF [Stieleria maiorica]
MSQTEALAGIRILDFSHVYQGPVGTQILADYGADVIKVERPGNGDWSRSWGPFSKDVSMPFANLNRNKRSITVDMKQDEGKALILKLVEKADILVHNFRKGVMEKLGFGYDELKAVNPGLIYATSSGWGDAGPYADRGRAGHDMMARAEAGWFTFYDDEKTPIPGGISIDYAAGLNLMVGILTALAHRLRTGEGQFVSTDLLSVAFHAHAWDAASQLNGEKIDRPAAVGGTEAAIDKAFKTLDGFIEISPVFSDNALRDISAAMALGDLSLKDEFRTEDLQVANRDKLNDILASEFLKKTTSQWMDSLESQGVLCARINNFQDAANDPQIACNNMIVSMEDSEVGELRMLGTPVRLKATPPQLKSFPPKLGQHNRAVAAELGYTEDEITDLFKKGVLANEN